MTNATLPKSAKSYRRDFPKLTDENYEETSLFDTTYNCIGHAAGSKKWWQPVKYPGFKPYWPEGAPRQQTIAAYIQAYNTLGYEVCADGSLEEGVEKVAIYALFQVPKHAAVQLPDGRWSSKLGQEEDIAHQLSDLTGTSYGQVVQYLSRQRKPS